MADDARRARMLLLAGMALGLAAAAGSLLSRPSVLPDGVVARVGDRLITESEWQRAVAAVAADRRTPLTDADRRRVLERLVDEELLLQHALALRLLEQDRRLRGQLITEVLALTAARAPEPDEAALRAWYDAHRDALATPARLHVRARRDAAPFSPPLPDAALPPAKLREYLGPRLTEVAMQLPPGEVRRVEDGAGAVTLELVAVEPGVVPPFEQVRAAVRESARRDAEEQEVRRLLAQLRESLDVRLRAP